MPCPKNLTHTELQFETKSPELLAEWHFPLLVSMHFAILSPIFLQKSDLLWDKKASEKIFKESFNSFQLGKFLVILGFCVYLF